MATNHSELDAVNIILSNIGQVPVTNLNTPNPAVQLAYGILDEVQHAVQQEGWVFNTERGYPFNPEADGCIRIAPNVLALDVSPYHWNLDVVRRDGKLYDKRNHTYQFKSPISADVTWEFEFSDLPPAFQNYCTIRAANLFAARAIGSTEVVKYSEKEEEVARATMLEYECNQGDYTYFSDRDGRTRKVGYRPLQAVYRY